MTSGQPGFYVAYYFRKSLQGCHAHNSLNAFPAAISGLNTFLINASSKENKTENMFPSILMKTQNLTYKKSLYDMIPLDKTLSMLYTEQQEY